MRGLILAVRASDTIEYSHEILMEAVEWATLKWGDWFNHQRLLGPIGHIPPAEHEANHYRQLDDQAMAAWLNPNNLRETRDGSARLDELLGCA